MHFDRCFGFYVSVSIKSKFQISFQLSILYVITLFSMHLQVYSIFFFECISIAVSVPDVFCSRVSFNSLLSFPARLVYAARHEPISLDLQV